ncbi:MAG: DUF4436 family protein [Mycolicibacterium sp.]|uniref:DUF4436 family protein n=1 Tax=Mycolicibacterium sp. TaxID=2320850 RepID=UPI003D0E7521
MQRATVLTTLFAVIAVYAASLIGYRLLESPAPVRLDESAVVGESAVIIWLRTIEATENRLSVDVRVHPGPDLRSLTPAEKSEVTVRLTSWGESGELIYAQDIVAGNEASTTLVAVGDPDYWPFDSYVTDTLGVELFVGEGEAQRVVPARIVVAGHINGWNVDDHMGTIDQGPASIPTVYMTMDRTRGALAFDVGILLVLLSMPATALFVAIEMFLGRRKFQPPFITWFAAMLFAVVPLRNFLPGAPPAGAWIDLAVVLWVLMALAGAMVVFAAAWWRQTKGDMKPDGGSPQPPSDLDSRAPQR